MPPDGIRKLGRRGVVTNDLKPADGAEVVRRLQIQRVRHGQFELPIVHFEGQHAPVLGQISRHAGQSIAGNLDVRQVDTGNLVLNRQGVRQVVLPEKAEPDQLLPESLPISTGQTPCLGQSIRRDVAQVDENLTDSIARHVPISRQRSGQIRLQKPRGPGFDRHWDATPGKAQPPVASRPTRLCDDHAASPLLVIPHVRPQRAAFFVRSCRFRRQDGSNEISCRAWEMDATVSLGLPLARYRRHGGRPLQRGSAVAQA